MLSGDNSILQKTTDAKESSERVEAKEQAQIDIMAWITDKVANHEDTSLNDAKIKEILTNKSYVKDGQPGNESFITSKGEYEIQYSELYIASSNPSPTAIYAKFYTNDGILILSSTDYTDPTLGEYTDYGDVSQKTEYYQNANGSPILLGEYPDWINPNVYYPSNFTLKKVIIHDNIVPTRTAYWFAGCFSLQEIQGLEKMNTNLVTDMQHMFSYCQNINNFDLSNLDTSNVTNMSYMFNDCGMSLTTINVNNFDTSKVTNMSHMFDSSGFITTLNVDNFNTSNVTDMSGMFYRCNSLEQLDLSNFNTKNVMNASEMLKGSEGDNPTFHARVFIGNDWTLTEAQTEYNGTFERKN